MNHYEPTHLVHIDGRYTPGSRHPKDDGYVWRDARGVWICHEEDGGTAVPLERARRLFEPPFSNPVLHYSKCVGTTIDEMRAHARLPGCVGAKADSFLVWVDEGDFWMLGLHGVDMLECAPTEDPVR